MTYSYSDRSVEGIGFGTLQEEVSEWQAYNFPDSTMGWIPILGATEEVGELSHAYLKKFQKIRKQNYDEKMKDAIGDTIVYLTDFCNKMGWSIQECIEIAWGEARERDWVRFPLNGKYE